MASEDSDQVGSGLVAVHGLHGLDEIEQAGAGQVMAVGHRAHAKGEAMEVAPLRGTQRVRLEERDDSLKEVIPIADDEHQTGVVGVAAARRSTNPGGQPVPGQIS